MKRLAVSYVLSVLLMTLVTTSLGTVVLLWSISEVTTSQNTFGMAMRARVEKAQERLIVENVGYSSIDDTLLTVYVRNVGAVSLVVDAAYVNKRQCTLNVTQTLGVGELQAFLLTSPVALSSDTSHYVVIATQRGSTVAGYWERPA